MGKHATCLIVYYFYTLYDYRFTLSRLPAEVNIPEVEATMTTPASMSCEEWLLQWSSHISRTIEAVQVPPTTTAISSPLKIHSWISLLKNHPNKQLTSFFITGLSRGFRIGYKSKKSLQSAKHYLSCALEHPEVVDQYLAKELLHH